MSAKDDYRTAQAWVRLHSKVFAFTPHSLHWATSEGTTPAGGLVDLVRELITGTRLEERKQWSTLAKQWADQLAGLDEEYLAVWLRHFADNIKNGVVEGAVGYHRGSTSKIAQEEDDL